VNDEHHMNGQPRICFFAERHLGIGTATSAVEPYLRALPNCTWIDVGYWRQDGIAERLPLLPHRVTGTLRGFLEVQSALRQGPFDAVAFVTHNPAVLGQRIRRKTPTLIWTDVTPALLDAQAQQYAHPVNTASPIRALKHALVRRTFQRASLCIGWSEWARRSFAMDYHIPDAATRVLPPGIDLSRWTFPLRDSSCRRPRLLFVGRHFVRKGGDLLLEIFRTRLRGRADLDIVTGDDVANEEGVRVHRNISSGSSALVNLYRRATVFVLPTRGDCFSMASLEAMAMGLPVVVSAVGGIPEIVAPGDTGFIVAPGDGHGLGDALEAFVSDPQRSTAMGLRGRARVEERFDAKKTAERLGSLLLELCAVGRTRSMPEHARVATGTCGRRPLQSVSGRDGLDGPGSLTLNSGHVRSMPHAATRS
jgi:glycosyltransferase involved in cell wall biosynthesis